jgi:putative proteasome-type protease
VAVLLQSGMLFAWDPRAYAGVDDFASFCQISVFESSGDRGLLLLSDTTSWDAA